MSNAEDLLRIRTDGWGQPHAPFHLVDSETIKATCSGRFTTRLKLADPPEGKVWFAGVQQKWNKKTIQAIGLTIHTTRNVNYEWYYLVDEAEAKSLLVPWARLMLAYCEAQKGYMRDAKRIRHLKAFIQKWGSPQENE